MLFDAAGNVLGSVRRELPQHFPQPGWVEHDATRLLDDVIGTVREALARTGTAAADVAALGITNQRETTVIWERDTGRPIHRAIVWQDRRTAAACREGQQHSAWLNERTGLLLDPYFSATKIAWLLDNVPGARARAEAGELAFGTVDTWLIWHLTGGKVHATDATNASRTALFDITLQDWSEELLQFFGVPRSLLPRVLDSAARFGVSDTHLFGGGITIGGVAGDQQAAVIGQACFAPGMVKSTYGTGCFMVLNTGTTMTLSRHRLLSTIAYRLDGQATYALEGSIFVAGAAVQWLRDGLHLIANAADTEALAAAASDASGVYLVPAFTGLGAPWWDPEARGALSGLTRDTSIADIARATLESVSLQTRDLLEAMAQDAPAPAELRVDGGMTANGWLMQNLADLTGVPVVRPRNLESTALGAALLAGLHAGIYGSLDDIARLWHPDRRFAPGMAREHADARHAGWLDAVRRLRTLPAAHAS
jgi:glycerol kinase